MKSARLQNSLEVAVGVPATDKLFILVNFYNCALACGCCACIDPAQRLRHNGAMPGAAGMAAMTEPFPTLSVLETARGLSASVACLSLQSMCFYTGGS